VESAGAADWWGRWDRLHAGRVGPAVSALLDVVWLSVFVLIGRSSHAEGITLSGFLRTAWPFWAGLGAGWLVVKAWRRPAAPVPTGVVVWPVCVAVAMVLRAASGQGVAVAFIGVALAFVGLGLLGWRVLALLVRSPVHPADPVEAVPGRADGGGAQH
jgi:hypothetical protein